MVVNGDLEILFVLSVMNQITKFFNTAKTHCWDNNENIPKYKDPGEHVFIFGAQERESEYVFTYRTTRLRFIEDPKTKDFASFA